MQVRYVDDDVVESLDLQKEVWRPNGRLASAMPSAVPRIDDGRLIEEPTAFPRVTLKFEGEKHRHGR